MGGKKKKKKDRRPTRRGKYKKLKTIAKCSIYRIYLDY